MFVFPNEDWLKKKTCHLFQNVDYDMYINKFFFVFAIKHYIYFSG